jgi:hypothetical protein
MADAAIRNAERERDALAAKVNAAVAQIEDWKREIARIDQFVADWHRFAGVEPETAPQAPAAKAVPKPRAVKNSTKEEVAKLTREMIEAHGAPINRAALLAMLRERGLVIEGGEPETVLSTMLWRMGAAAQIVHLKGVGYWTSEKDWEIYQAAPHGEPRDAADEDPRDPDDMRDATLAQEADEKAERSESEPPRNRFALDLEDLENQLRGAAQR